MINESITLFEHFYLELSEQFDPTIFQISCWRLKRASQNPKLTTVP